MSDVEMEDQAQDAESLLGKLSASFDQKMRFSCWTLTITGRSGRPARALDPAGRHTSTTQQRKVGRRQELPARDKANKKVELKAGQQG